MNGYLVFAGWNVLAVLAWTAWCVSWKILYRPRGPRFPSKWGNPATFVALVLLPGAVFGFVVGIGLTALVLTLWPPLVAGTVAYVVAVPVGVGFRLFLTWADLM